MWKPTEWNRRWNLQRAKNKAGRSDPPSHLPDANASQHCYSSGAVGEVCYPVCFSITPSITPNRSGSYDRIRPAIPPITTRLPLPKGPLTIHFRVGISCLSSGREDKNRRRQHKRKDHQLSHKCLSLLHLSLPERLRCRSGIVVMTPFTTLSLT